MAIKPPTKAESAHMAAVVELGCIACYVMDIMDSPAEIHHIRAGQGASQKADSYHVLPLCPRHHNRPFTHGVAIHAGQETWEKKYGTEEYLLDLTNELLGMLK
jgi:hypothetical protein